MHKFILKYLIIFVSMISLLFFSLIAFNEKGMNRPPMDSSFLEFSEMSSPEKPMEEPPAAIPLIFIISISSIFVYLVLRDIDKNFVTPFVVIENKVKEIKEGSLEVNFETKSDNKVIKETYDTLNEMVQGLKQKEKLWLSKT